MKSSIQIGLLIAAVALLLGFVTFLRQWVGGQGNPSEPASQESQADSIFPRTKGVLDHAVEVHKSGHFDFEFANRKPVPLEMGFDSKSCKCTKVEMIALTPEEKDQFRQWPPAGNLEGKTGTLLDQPDRWQALEENNPALQVPAQSAGLVRLEWEAKQEGPLRLTARLWFQEQGRPQTRQYEILEVALAIVPPLRVSPDTISLGDVGPDEEKSADFICWSGTRDSFELTARLEPAHPCLGCSVKPLGAPECRDLEATLSQKGQKVQVRCGYRVTVVVHERLPGRNQQMDLGPFRHEVVLSAEDGSEVKAELKGVVRGEVSIAGDKVGVGLGNFPFDEGTSKEVPIETTRAGLELAVDDQWTPPPYLKAELTREPGVGDGGGTRWKLKVTVPPNLTRGPLPPGTNVVLKTKDNPPRRVQIPVTGDATLGR